MHIEHVDRAIWSGEPIEQGCGATKKQHVRVEHEAPTGAPDVSISELAQVQVGEPLSAQRWEAGRGEVFV